MVFTSHIFIFYFLPIVLLLYYLVPLKRNVLLLLASYAFYGWWQPWFVFLMLGATAANYACGRVIASSGGNPRRARMAVVASAVASLGLLGFFKYCMFAQENLNRLLALLGPARCPCSTSRSRSASRSTSSRD